MPSFKSNPKHILERKIVIGIFLRFNFDEDFRNIAQNLFLKD